MNSPQSGDSPVPAGNRLPVEPVDSPSDGAAAAPVPSTFLEYLRSFGPGLVIVLTWLGAGDVVESGTAGGNYGYALAWVIVLALVMRYLFVSLIARYQLCNPWQEGVLDGLARVHRWYAPLLMIVAVVMGHFYGAYMARGVGETWVALTGIGQTWMWASAWTALALLLVFRPVYRHVELVFKVLLAVLSLSFLYLAYRAGPDPGALVTGIFAFQIPPDDGPFDAMLVAIGTIGALGGSLMNLAYPYFLAEKGWSGPQYRRVQQYDFLLGIVVMIVLNLAIWTLGAELVYGKTQIGDLADLAGLMGAGLGRTGQQVFYLGVFAAVLTSLVGHAFGLAMMAAHGWLRWTTGQPVATAVIRSHPMYRSVVLWILLSPLVWTLPGMPNFVTLTLAVNSLQVVLIPVLAGGLWRLTASGRYLGEKYRNRWYENLVMLLVCGIAAWATWGSLTSLVRQFSGR